MEGMVQSALVGIAVTAELEVVFDTVSSLAGVREFDGAEVVGQPCASAKAMRAGEPW
jgi:hypothetical protein